MRVTVDGKPHPGTIGSRVRLALLDALPPTWEPLEGPVTLRLRFIFQRDPELPRAVPLEEPSLAALVRGVLDELTALVYGDERQVVAMHTGKEYGNVNRAELSW